MKRTSRVAKKTASGRSGSVRSRNSSLPRLEVRKSSVHGRGVYALETIGKGKRIIEYTGEQISWREAQKRHPHDPANPNHTFFFSLDNDNVIDANVGGNDARFINHSCEPNCEIRERSCRVFIHAARRIKSGEELFYDYGLVIDDPDTRQRKKDFACHCGTSSCRGTMLAPKE